MCPHTSTTCVLIPVYQIQVHIRQLELRQRHCLLSFLRHTLLMNFYNTLFYASWSFASDTACAFMFTTHFTHAFLQHTLLMVGIRAEVRTSFFLFYIMRSEASCSRAAYTLGQKEKKKKRKEKRKEERERHAPEQLRFLRNQHRLAASTI